MGDENPDPRNTLEVLGELLVIGACSVLMRLLGVDFDEEEEETK